MAICTDGSSAWNRTRPVCPGLWCDGVTRLGADHRIDPAFGTQCCRSIRPIDPRFDPGWRINAEAEEAPRQRTAEQLVLVPVAMIVSPNHRRRRKCPTKATSRSGVPSYGTIIDPGLVSLQTSRAAITPSLFCVSRRRTHPSVRMMSSRLTFPSRPARNGERPPYECRGPFGVIGLRLNLSHARMAPARKRRLQVLRPAGHGRGVRRARCLGPPRRGGCKHCAGAGQRTDLPSYRAADRASVHGGLAGGLRVYALDTPGILLPGISTPDATGAFRPHPRCRGVRKQSDSLRGSQDLGPSGSKVAEPNTTLNF